MPGYFDLRQPLLVTGEAAKKWIVDTNCMAFQYATLVTGIVVQPFFTQYQETKTWHVSDP